MTEIVQVTVDSTVIVQNTDTNVVEVTAVGPAGAQGPAGPGFSAGGDTGQVLAKASSADYDTEWLTISGTGTVTSVAASVPVGFSISGSPITASGTLTISFASGYSLPSDATQMNWNTAYGWGNHALAGYAHSGANSDITSLTGITGAISTVDSIQFDMGAGVAVAQGQIAWNSADGCLDIGMGYDGVVQQVGLEQYFRIKATATITNGQCIMFTGSVGASGVLTGAPATGVTNGQHIMGVATMDIANNGFGYVTTFGLVRGINTTGSAVGETWTQGDILYYNPSVAGGLTKNPPAAPIPKVTIAAVVNVGTAGSGSLFIRAQAEPDLHNLSDVYAPSPIADGQILIGDGAQERWESATLTAGTGISITNGAGGITIAATGGGGGSGTVTSVAASVPVGFAISGSPITTSGTLAISFDTGYSLPTNASQTNWNTAYTDRLKWDGGSTGLTASTGRTSLGATTIGSNLFTLTNPSAVTFPRFNADNTISALDATTFRTAIGAGVGNGTVTSVGLTPGTGISVSGSPITSSGSITVTNTAPMTYPGAGIAVSTGSAWGTSLTAPSGAIVGTTDTQTLTNKRVTPRASTTTSSATPTINTDNVDVYGLTAQAVDITSFTTNLTGTPTDGQKLWIYIVGTAARAITWGASFEASTIALPTTTVSTNRLDVGFVWNAAASKWRCMGVA